MEGFESERWGTKNSETTAIIRDIKVPYSVVMAKQGGLCGNKQEKYTLLNDLTFMRFV